MFYCDTCAEEMDLPTTFFRSRGTCECCGKYRDCSDRPTKTLPPPLYRRQDKTKKYYNPEIKTEH